MRIMCEEGEEGDVEVVRARTWGGRLVREGIGRGKHTSL